MTPAQAAVLADHLRSILSEQDAADVARWAAQPEAVRELLKYAPQTGAYAVSMDCADENCQASDDDAHLAKCRIAAAWRALGDPRGAADVERAWEEALAQVPWREEDAELRRRAFSGTLGRPRPSHEALLRVATHGEWAGMQTYAIEGVPCSPLQYTFATTSRPTSDSRGMEAVEDEADAENDRRAYPEIHGPPQLLPDRHP